MSSIEDDSINGSRVDKTKSDTNNYRNNRQPSTLRDRILHYAINTEKPTKGGIFTHVSGSGSCGTLVSALISERILIEHKFECGSCVYFEVDKTKVKLEV